jgi:hypothetical protein
MSPSHLLRKSEGTDLKVRREAQKLLRASRKDLGLKSWPKGLLDNPLIIQKFAAFFAHSYLGLSNIASL